MEAVIMDALTSIIKILFGDPGAQLLATLQTIESVGVADLTTAATAFSSAYQHSYGLVVGLSVGGMFITVIWNVFRSHRDDTNLKPWNNSFKVFLLGLCLPAAVIVVRIPMDYASQLVLHLFGDEVAWNAALSKDYAVPDFPSKMIFGFLNWVMRWVLKGEAQVSAMSAPLFVILLLISYSLAITFTGKIGRLTRWFFSLVVTSIVIKPLMLFILAGGGSLVVTSTADDGAKAQLVFWIEFVAAFVIFFVFLVTNHVAKSTIEKGRVAVNGDVNARLEEPYTPVAEMQDQMRQRMDAMKTASGGVIKDDWGSQEPSSTSTSSQDSTAGVAYAAPSGGHFAQHGESQPPDTDALRSYRKTYGMGSEPENVDGTHIVEGTVDHMSEQTPGHPDASHATVTVENESVPAQPNRMARAADVTTKAFEIGSALREVHKGVSNEQHQPEAEKPSLVSTGVAVGMTALAVSQPEIAAGLAVIKHQYTTHIQKAANDETR